MIRSTTHIARLTALASVAAAIASCVGGYNLSDCRVKQSIKPLRSA